MDYTISMSDVASKALSAVAIDPQEWVLNIAKERARIAIDDLATKEIQRIMAEGGTITGTKEDIVLAGFTTGTLKPLVDQQATAET
jgi:hypothetical protein